MIPGVTSLSLPATIFPSTRRQPNQEASQLERTKTIMQTPNHALQVTRPSRPGCNPTPSWPPSLSLGR